MTYKASNICNINMHKDLTFNVQIHNQCYFRIIFILLYLLIVWIRFFCSFSLFSFYFVVVILCGFVIFVSF